MKDIEKGYEFESTGRNFYANGYIGAFEGNHGIIRIAEGYDGFIRLCEKDGEESDDDKQDLTQEERNELADYMIGIWIKFKNQ